MTKDTILVRSLDTIAQTLHNFQHKLSDFDTIKSNIDTMKGKITTIDVQCQGLLHGIERLNGYNSWDIWVRVANVAIILASGLIGVWLFYKNRHKDFHIKKAEIAGEIYGNIFEFKRIKLVLWEAEMKRFVHSMAGINKDVDENKKKFLDKLFGIVVPDNPINKTDELKVELDAVRKNLLNKIGQYRFYVNKAEKSALKFHSNAVTVDRVWPVLFADGDYTIQQIEQTYHQLIADELDKEKSLLNKQFGAIEAIIEDYNDYIKAVDLFVDNNR